MNYQEILDQIKPTAQDQEHITSVIEEITSYIKEQASKQLFKIEVTPGGSTAKGTWLKGNFDVDIFVRFKDYDKDYSDALELLLKDLPNTRIERVHGSRDYFNFTYKELHFEIVPVKYVESSNEVENVTDMSPLHVQWVQQHSKISLQDDIRLAKQFCKAAQVYGAESYINGVSGHVLDILLIHYGSFDKFIKEVSLWGKVTVIDHEQQHEDVFKELNQSKLNSPLIVIDPVDKLRNAAAAVSVEKYELLINQAKLFLEQPNNSFFTLPRFKKESLLKEKHEDEHLVIVEVKPQDGKKDIVITKIFKVFEFLKRHLALYDFDSIRADWFVSDTCYLYFYLPKKELDPTFMRSGPPLKQTEDVTRFKEAHPDAFEKDGRMHATINRKFTKSLDCFDHLLNQSFVQERVAKINREVL